MKKRTLNIERRIWNRFAMLIFVWIPAPCLRRDKLRRNDRTLLIF